MNHLKNFWRSLKTDETTQLFTALIVIVILLPVLGYFAGKEEKSKRDYQIDVTQTGAAVYDGSRLVGVIAYDSTSKLDRLINADNQ